MHRYAWSLRTITTGLLGLPAKLELGRLLAALGRIDTAALDHLTINEWLERVRMNLGSVPGLALTGIERRLLLDLARIAAHASERVAAPLSTYLVGVALAELPPEERAERLAAIVRDLESSIGQVTR